LTKSWFRRRSGDEAGRDSSEIPKQIGKYELVEKLGSGGFGTVYKGWDPTIERFVAIKTYETEGKELRARAAREVQLSANLLHENITTLYESAVENGVPYLVYELLSGQDLSALIAQREPRTLGEKLQILVGIARGLDYAHKAGVVHRDIKPANIRILENGTVKIMDFGLAKAIGASADITKKGIAVGSSSYMAPEQICGDPLDGRTDIFSLGVLAYQLFSFVSPFRHQRLFRLLEMIVKEEPEPLGDLAPDLPSSLVAVVQRAMRKNPADRFSSAGELGEALTEFVTISP
jgi:serine/threonine protein kinase